MIKAIDLFAGIGGIRLGFEQAFNYQIETIFVSELDHLAQRTYKTNFKDNFEITGDITIVDEKTIPHFDICLAGFPCQAFSTAGRREGFEDNYKGICRGTLFLDVARICEYHQPAVIFCENVKGLVHHNGGQTFKIICSTFESLGYKVFWKILNSRNYGVPQNRERVYIVAFRNDIAPEQFEFPATTDSSKCLKDILENEPVPARYYISERALAGLKKHRKQQQERGNSFGYIVRDLEDAAGTIVCGGMGHERNLIVDKRQTDLTPPSYIKGELNKQGIRKMTPREWARLQGFPDDFILADAPTRAYKQLANSVTVPVIKAIALQIKKVLNSQAIN